MSNLRSTVALIVLFSFMFCAEVQAQEESYIDQESQQTHSEEGSSEQGSEASRIPSSYEAEPQTYAAEESYYNDPGAE